MKGLSVKTSNQSYITDKFVSKLVHNQPTYEHLKKHIDFAIFPNLFVLVVLEELKKYALIMLKHFAIFLNFSYSSFVA